MATSKDGADGRPEGLRERKRRETLRRITETGVRLFMAKGYEATTLDEIAAEAGIARRTFFYYFKSKDDILLSLQSDFGEWIVEALQQVPPDRAPLDAVRAALVTIFEPYRPEDLLLIDRLMRSSPTLQARKQATYVQQEARLFAALCRRYPDPRREAGLRLVAMLSVGALRLSFDAWSGEGGTRPVVELLHETFDALDREIRGRGDEPA